MKIKLLNYTHNPLHTIGVRASYCYNTKLKDKDHATRIGRSVILDGHGRNLEFVDVEFVASEVSARMVRELYTHIGGDPTRLQASTRYITYKDFEYHTPEELSDEQLEVYKEVMTNIQDGYGKLKELNLKNDITGYALPLAMDTTFVWKGNLRNLINMFNQRLCKRALKEYQDLMKLLKQELSQLDDEWEWIASNYFVPKCIASNNICYEKHGCNMCPHIDDIKPYLDEAFRKYREDHNK